MILKAFAVYDIKAGAYFPPAFLPSRGVAIRQFSDAVNKPDHDFGKHPEDYRLCDCGSFNDNTGEMIGVSVPEILGTGVDFMDKR